MSVTVTYSTVAFLERNRDNAGQQLQASFSSVNDAKAAPIPTGYSFAYVPVEDGYFTYSTRFGWEFHTEKNVS